MSPDHIIKHLQLIPHPEGGYFREIYRSGAKPMLSRGQTDHAGELLTTTREGELRNVMTSIYWMPTRSSPLVHWCSNQSDHIHYYHHGAPLTYHLVHADGSYQRRILGPDVTQGQEPQVDVPGNCYKAAELEAGEYTLLGEAVAPGFDFRDFAWVSEQQLQQRLQDSQLVEQLSRFLKTRAERDFDRYYE